MRVEDTVYDQPSATDFVGGVYYSILWLDSQQLVNTAPSFSYSDGVAVPRPYYQWPTTGISSFNAPANTVLIWGANTNYYYPYSSNGVAGTVCQYGT